MGEDLTLTAFDIETTGLEVDDVVTVVGFEQPLGCRVFCLDPDSDRSVTGDGIEASVEPRVDTNVVVSVCETEAALLEAVGEFVGHRLQGNGVLLVAYNGEQYTTGFDLPFLRTRLALTDVDWPFTELPYADLMPIITRQFNTRLDGADRSDLPTAYEVLCDGELGTVDPFDESEAAARAFEAGEIEDVVVHNVADVLRTAAVGQVARRYCSRSDFQLKSLTPATDA